MKPRSVKPLSADKAEDLPTVRLLAYLKKLQQCEESIETSDWEAGDLARIEGIVFKSSEEWRNQYKLVTDVLARRPHLD